MSRGQRASWEDAFPRGAARPGWGCGGREGGGCGVPVGPCAAGAPGGGEPRGPRGGPAASIVTATLPSACLCVSICARAHVAHAAPASIARAAPSPERTAPALLLALSRLASGTELTHAAPRSGSCCPRPGRLCVAVPCLESMCLTRVASTLAPARRTAAPASLHHPPAWQAPQPGLLRFVAFHLKRSQRWQVVFWAQTFCPRHPGRLVPPQGRPSVGPGREAMRGRACEPPLPPFPGSQAIGGHGVWGVPAGCSAWVRVPLGGPR